MAVTEDTITAAKPVCVAYRPPCNVVMLAVAVLFLILFPRYIHAETLMQGFSGMPVASQHFGCKPTNKSMVEGRVGYLWGVNTIWFRDGTNDNSPPGKKEVRLDGPVFGIQGKTRVLTDDLGLRAQAWITLPQKTRGHFFLDLTDNAQGLTSRAWDTESRYLAVDVAAIYYLGPFGHHINHLGSVGMPYTAGLVAGYRYNNLDYRSTRSAPDTGTFHDHIHVHIPYIGVHYAHEDFAGSLVRLDILASPLTLTQLDAERHLTGVITRFEGQSVTGFWFESLFSWSWPVSNRAFLGIFTNYNYLELSGGATVNRSEGAALDSTRFSMDSITHVIMAGVSGVVTF